VGKMRMQKGGESSGVGSRSITAATGPFSFEAVSRGGCKPGVSEGGEGGVDEEEGEGEGEEEEEEEEKETGSFGKAPPSKLFTEAGAAATTITSHNMMAEISARSKEELEFLLGPPRKVKPPKLLLGLLRGLFNRGCTPGVLVRGLGPFSRAFVSCNFRIRAARWVLENPWPANVTKNMAEYMFHVTASPGCGEYALNKLMTGHAYARLPLLPRITAGVERGGGGFSKDIPITFFFGGLYDWIDIEGGRLAAQLLETLGFTNVAVHSVPLSGHHLYLENPTDTNRLIIRGLKSVKMVE